MPLPVLPAPALLFVGFVRYIHLMMFELHVFEVIEILLGSISQVYMETFSVANPSERANMQFAK
jgi:uncharacterized protein YqgC (DUF456 family)